MTKPSKKGIRYLKYQIYSYLYENPWIPSKKIIKLVGCSISTVNRYAKEVKEGAVIWNP